MIRLSLIALDGLYSVCRLPHGGAPPEPDAAWPFYSLTRTREEISFICPTPCVPPGAQAEHGWSCLRVEGTLAFAEVGILASLLSPLAEGGIPVFVVSTFDTDYLMIKEAHLGPAVRALREAGHRVTA
ncbi:MAG: ACT domain-containing protein [Isosphaeraceae bacterium]